MKAIRDAALVGLAIIISWFIGAGHLADHRQQDLRERELVLQCVVELGWEFADEDADDREALEQSVAWCERFVAGAAEP